MGIRTYSFWKDIHTAKSFILPGFIPNIPSWSQSPTMPYRAYQQQRYLQHEAGSMMDVIEKDDYRQEYLLTCQKMIFA